MASVSADNSLPLAPPGLEGLADQGFVGPVAGVGLPPRASDEQSLADRIRDAVLAEVDGKIKVRMDEAFQRGKDMMTTMQQRSKETTTELRKELTQCQEKVKMLEAENHKLVLAMARLDKHTLGMEVAGSLAAASPPRIAYGKPCTLESPIRLPLAGGREQASMERGIFDADVPPFPAAAAAPPHLALAEAVSAPVQRTQLSLVESLCPPASTNVSSASASDAGAAVVEFSFTILKADGMELGLSVAHQEEEPVLHVEGVCQDGAVDAWNRQCSGHAAHKVVRRGDKIVSVNAVTNDPAKMLEECRNKRLLKLSVLRTVEAESSGASSLRAGASVFVPMPQDKPQAYPELEF